MNRIEREASVLSGGLVVKEKSFAKRFWAYTSSLLCVWFFACGYIFYRSSGFNTRVHSYWDSTVRVRIGQTGLSSSDFLFGAAIYCGACAVIYFVFGIIVRRPFAILCGYAHLGISVQLPFSPASYIPGTVSAPPPSQRPCL